MDYVAEELLEEFPHQVALIELLAAEEKSPEQVEDIYNHLEGLPYIRSFFDENTPDKTSAFELCKSMKQVYFEKGDVIMAQGDKSDDNLYVIIEGNVAIVANHEGPTAPAGAIYSIKYIPSMLLNAPCPPSEAIFYCISPNEYSFEQAFDVYQMNDEVSEMFQSRIQQSVMVESDEVNTRNKWTSSSNRPRSHTTLQQQTTIENETKPSPPRWLLNPQRIPSSLLASIDIHNEPQPSNLKIPLSNVKISVSNTRIVTSNELNPHQAPLLVSVSQFVPATNRSIKKPNILLDTPQSSYQATDSVYTNSKIKDEHSKEKMYNKQILSFGTKINEIGKGGGFGDKALLKENQKFATRNVTIIAQTPLYCITLHRNDFLRVVDVFSKGTSEKEDCITREFSFFKNVSSSTLKERYLYYFQSVKLLKNEFVCKAGETGSGFFLLFSGKVTVSKNFEDPMSVYFKRQKPVKLCLIDTPTFFGAEILFGAASLFDLSVQVVSQKAELFFCSKQLFLTKFPKDAHRELKQRLRLRNTAYQELFEAQCKVLNYSNSEMGQSTSIVQRAHNQNFQQNKELYLQMASNSIDKQIKRAIPKLINSIENNDVAFEEGIQLDGGLQPSVIAFSSQIELTLKQQTQDRDLIKDIFTQKKSRMDRRNQQYYSKKVSRNQQANTEPNDTLKQPLSPVLNKPEIGLKENHESLLREFSRLGLLGRPNSEYLDLNLLYKTTDDVYSDKDVNFLLYVGKPKQTDPFSQQKKTSDLPTDKDGVSQVQVEEDQLENETQKVKEAAESVVYTPTMYNHEDLDIGYIEDFKREQYFRNIRIGVIKSPKQASPPPKVDIKKSILEKFLKSKSRSSRRFPNLPKEQLASQNDYLTSRPSTLDNKQMKSAAAAAPLQHQIVTLNSNPDIPNMSSVTWSKEQNPSSPNTIKTSNSSLKSLRNISQPQFQNMLFSQKSTRQVPVLSKPPNLLKNARLRNSPSPISPRPYSREQTSYQQHQIPWQYYNEQSALDDISPIRDCFASHASVSLHQPASNNDNKMIVTQNRTTSQYSPNSNNNNNRKSNMNISGNNEQENARKGVSGDQSSPKRGKPPSYSPLENAKFAVKQYPFPIQGKLLYQSKLQNMSIEGTVPASQANRFRSTPSPPRLLLPHNNQIGSEYLSVTPISISDKLKSPPKQKRIILTEPSASLKQKSKTIEPCSDKRAVRLIQQNELTPRPDSSESQHSFYSNIRQIYMNPQQNGQKISPRS